MLKIAMGMKEVQQNATENPMVAFMAQNLNLMREDATEDEFLTFLAKFALTISAMAIGETVQLCLDDNAQDELQKTILELMEISEMAE